MPSRDWAHWIEAINEESTGLTPWELEFMRHMNQMLREYGPDKLLLTERQAHTLRRLYDGSGVGEWDDA